MTEITSEMASNYVFRFGRYNKLRAVDVLNITEIDKNENEKPAGYLYMKWLIEKADWFKDKPIIAKILKDAGLDEEPQQEDTKIDPPKEEKKGRVKKNKEATVKISTEKKTVDFQ